jgi:hypothetical protein
MIVSVSSVKSVDTLLSRDTATSSPDVTFSQYCPSLNRLQRASGVTRWIGGVGVGLSLMITVDQIRSVLQQVVLSKMSLDDFDEWLTKTSWNMHKDSVPDAIQAVGKIELCLAEAGRKEISDQDLAQDLLASLPSVEIRNVMVSVIVCTGGRGSSTAFNPPLLQWAVAGKQHEKECGSVPPQLV